MRYSAVAGTFYAHSKELLILQIEECYKHKLGSGELKLNTTGSRKIKGCIVPHAGYMYSGPTATHIYKALGADNFPETFVIIGPNHTGYGNPVALTTETFSTPLGNVEVDKELAKSMLTNIIAEDINAHKYEHSIEVQLPFLLYIKKNFKIVPICMGMQDYETATEVGNIIKKSVKGKDVVVLASTDFTHYEPKQIAEKKDNLAISAILECNPKKLYDVVMDNNISVCGYGAIVAMLTAVQPTQGKLLSYTTSGDISPMQEVVGYAGIVVI